MFVAYVLLLVISPTCTFKAFTYFFLWYVNTQEVCLAVFTDYLNTFVRTFAKSIKSFIRLTQKLYKITPIQPN